MRDPGLAEFLKSPVNQCLRFVRGLLEHANLISLDKMPSLGRRLLKTFILAVRFVEALEERGDANLLIGIRARITIQGRAEIKLPK